MVLLSAGGAMAAYSRDLRQRVVRARDGGMPVAAVAARFDVSVAWVYRVLQRRRMTGSIVFVDESGVTTGPLRRYGRSLRGGRPRDYTPYSGFHFSVAAVLC